MNLVFPKKGKYNFTSWWNMIQCRKKDKPFNCNMDPDKNLFMKLKQFKERTARKILESSSDKEHRANALASGAEEGRDKLR